tara:strand:- start:7978 stop:8097 length:120 start_codon:yes stop_codon:yes gene_type:complete
LLLDYYNGNELSIEKAEELYEEAADAAAKSIIYCNVDIR